MRRPVDSLMRRRGLVLVFCAMLVMSVFPAATFAHPPAGGDLSVPPTGDPERNPYLQPGRDPLDEGDDQDEELLKANDAVITRRTAGDVHLSVGQAGEARSAAHDASKHLTPVAPISPTTFDSPWTEISPNPIVQVTRGSSSFYAVAGRVSALAIRPSNGLKILGAAQGGIWTYDEATDVWVPRTDNQSTLSIGSIAIAPSNDNVVYAGTGEGNLSGDSYFGNGFLKSTDGGIHWAPIGGKTFHGVSIAKVIVDVNDADHVYAAVIRGRAGSRRTTPIDVSKYGLWESKNGGKTWQNIKKVTDELHGATDIVQDPGNPNTLYAAFWADGIYRSTDAGKHWQRFMTGVPAAATFGTNGGTRFALGISHPAGHDAVLYAGFEWTVAGVNQPSRIWKSVNGGAWSLLPGGTPGGADSISGYCGTQCFYDNVMAVDPNDANTVYALGLFNYNIGSGGIFRSTDGGQTWKNLGWDLHPDYHSIAIDPADTSQVMIGNDGGVWFSDDQGGRLGPTDPIDSVDWQDLNGTVNPNTAGVIHRTGLAITQFTSIANNPTLPGRVWGGTQDNGTLRKSTASASWFDVESGDGGQVLVDPTDFNYVYGNYFGISAYRNTDGGAGFFTNSFITGGINLADRSDFYVPEIMNQGNPNQLFLGTYRVYRTDNAKADDAAAVHWTAISPDLTSGCTGGASNGARGCLISALGVSSGGNGVYAGTLEGWVQFSPDAVTNPSPTWTRVGQSVFPNRPVSDIAVDRSNDRIAYAAFNGYNAGTPSRPGHVFATTDGGAHWKNISSNLPDVPVNSLQIDASYPNTLYAGTDVGPFVTYNGGKSWQVLGSGFPTVEIWQLNLDPANRNLAAGTHGRGAWTMHDAATVPALVVGKADSGAPVGPGKDIAYTITVNNIGNADATGVTVTDPIPANTSFKSAGEGGVLNGGKARWTGLTVAAGDSITLHLTVTISLSLASSVKSIIDDGLTVTSAQNVGATGSAHVTPIAPAHAVTISPTPQNDGAHVGGSVDYTFHITNSSFNDDSYTLGVASGAFTATVLDATCTTALTSVSVASGASADVCVHVSVPGSAANAATDTATLTATSTGDPSVSASGTATTTAVAVDVLVVDNDHHGNPPLPDVRAFYTTALTSAGQTFDVADLETNPVLPLGYMKAHKTIVWFTGASYPDPVGPYEANLKAFLDGGGRLLMSGQDILDQGAGTTDFFKNYVHINWDGTETQNDKPTANVTGVTGNPVTNGIATVPLDHSVLGAPFEDRITPIAPATAAFTDATAQTDGLTVASGAYKVVFLAFPFEEFGTAAQKADLMTRVFTYFNAP